MPPEGYVTVTLKEETLERLDEHRFEGQSYDGVIAMVLDGFAAYEHVDPAAAQNEQIQRIEEQLDQLPERIATELANY